MHARPGTWIKDTGASDLAAYGRALDLMGLGRLQKTTALRLIEGLEIEQRGSDIAVRFLTVVPFFKVGFWLGCTTPSSSIGMCAVGMCSSIAGRNLMWQEQASAVSP